VQILAYARRGKDFYNHHRYISLATGSRRCMPSSRPMLQVIRHSERLLTVSKNQNPFGRSFRPIFLLSLMNIAFHPTLEKSRPKGTTVIEGDGNLRFPLASIPIRPMSTTLRTASMQRCRATESSREFPEQSRFAMDMGVLETGGPAAGRLLHVNHPPIQRR
jgi:hypothetical protein